MLAPMLRIRLNKLVALPSRSLGTGSLVTVVSGTKISPRAAALQCERENEVSETDVQTQAETEETWLRQMPECPRPATFLRPPWR